jgi:hypothetical protein
MDVARLASTNSILGDRKKILTFRSEGWSHRLMPEDAFVVAELTLV